MHSVISATSRVVSRAAAQRRSTLLQTSPSHPILIECATQCHRFQSSQPRADVCDDGYDDATTDADAPPMSLPLRDDTEPHLDNNTAETITDYTAKAGTPSPWAVFDAWGAGGEMADPLSAADEDMLSPEMVRIPTTEEDRASMSDESDILASYDKLLKRKSSVHFGYPYNLMYNHEELYEFMKYSINNLGDPFITSNYGVHSRQFECAVIDFFADLWKMDKVKSRAEQGSMSHCVID